MTTLTQVRKKLAEQQRLLAQELKQAEATRQKVLEDIRAEQDEAAALSPLIQTMAEIVDKMQAPPAQSASERDPVRYAQRIAALDLARAAKESKQARKDEIYQNRLTSLKKARRVLKRRRSKNDISKKG